MLRSVSPIHIQYLKNMGVAASMSISVLDEDRLWGLIACHHYAPRYVLNRLRAASDLLGQVFSMHFALRRRQQAATVATETRQHLARLVERLVAAERIAPMLCGHADAQEGVQSATTPMVSALDLLDAGWVTVCLEEDVCLHGTTPVLDHVQDLLEWLASEYADTDQHLVHTDRLADVLPPHFASIAGDAAGLLALAVAGD
ncbi:MAG: GAF domain-containing protein, partial [Bacteroidota bacterium]